VVWAASACGGIVRTHIHQRLCDAGLSHQEVTAATAGATAALCLLGMVSLLGSTPDRITADLAGLALLVAYLGSPKALARTRKRHRGAHATTATRGA
jgi:UDP-GlcNAc:undecaprenyl-phosphate/decaprenyl-phosphate GlcNAc-1-phosphate transferase